MTSINHFREGRIASIAGDRKLAVEMYRRGVEAGDVRCMLALSGRLTNRDEPWYDPQEAMTLVERAAAAGHPEAFEVLGIWYIRGEGQCTIDIEKAIDYLTRASVAAQPEAMRQLALLYIQDAAHKDVTQALGLLRHAAMLGHPPSWYTYALVLWDGVGGKRELIEAGAWMTLAARFDYKDSRARLEGIGLGASFRLVLTPLFWRRRVRQRVDEIMQRVTPYCAHPEDDSLYDNIK